MPLRRGKPDDEATFSFYDVGTAEEAEAAASASAEVALQALAAAQRVADEQGVQLAEVLWRTASRLQEEVQALLMQDPPWPEGDE
jgi:hypothetical protein